MYKLLKIILVIIILSVSFKSVSFASDTGFVQPDSAVDHSGVNVTDPNNILLEDANLSVISGSTGAIRVNFPYELPTESTESISIQMRYVAKNNGGTSKIRVSIAEGNGDTTCPTSGYSTPTALEQSLTGTLTAYTTPLTEITLFDTQDWIDNNICFIIQATTGSYPVSVDNVSINIQYNDTTLNYQLDDSTASLSAGLVYLDLSGDIGYTSDNVKCNISIFENKTKSGFAGGISNTPVATIILEALNPRTETVKSAGNTYYGYGFSPTSSQWFAKDVEVPYNAGWSTTYPLSYSCYESECTLNASGTGSYCSDPVLVASGQSLNPNQPNYQPSLVATPSATLTQDDFQACTAFDLICKATNDMKRFLIDMFAIDSELNILIISEIKEDLMERAPFAYALSILSIDTSAPAHDSSVPTLSFAFQFPVGSGLDSSYDWEAPTFLDTVISSWLTVVRVLLYTAFIFYLLHLSRRLIN